VKTKKTIQLVVLFMVVAAPFFFPAPAEALTPSGPWVKILSPNKIQINTGPYTSFDAWPEDCDGKIYHLWGDYGTTAVFSPSVTIKLVTVTFFTLGDGSETITVCSGYCGCPATAKSKKVSTCGGVSIPSRVPRSPAVLVTFKGPGNITHANITFKDLGYSLSLWLHHYDRGSGRWYGYLNTLYLPLGKHHGRVNTYVDGVRGGGCATGGFKVVDE
jgi:hypothetical protein